MLKVRSVAALVAVALLAVSAAACGKDSPLTPTAPTLPAAVQPVISLFQAEAPSITLGQSTILRWEVLDKDAAVRIDPGPGNVAYVGSAVLAPQATITYTLLARGVNGLTSQRNVTVTVRTAAGVIIQ